MLKILYLTVGAPGSGKSTFCEKLIAKRVSRDAIRFSMINDNDKYFQKEKDVWKEYVHQIQEEINANNTVIADATHLNKKSRQKLLNALDLKDYVVFVLYFNVPLSTCLARNAKRTNRERVPKDVITDMYNHMTEPTLEEDERYFAILSINDEGLIYRLEQR